MYVILGLETHWNRDGKGYRTYRPASTYLFETKNDAYYYLRFLNKISRPMTVKQPIVCHESEMPKIVGRQAVRDFYGLGRSAVPVMRF